MTFLKIAFKFWLNQVLKRKKPLEKQEVTSQGCTRSGTWTRTGIAAHWILSPACLPIPPSEPLWWGIKKERKTGFEPATSTLARLRSTNWAIFAFHLFLRQRKGTTFFKTDKEKMKFFCKNKIFIATIWLHGGCYFINHWSLFMIFLIENPAKTK